jgi:hypothetical protein
VVVETESFDMLEFEALVGRNTKGSKALLLSGALNFMLQWYSRAGPLFKLEIGVKSANSNKDVLRLAFFLGKLLDKIAINFAIILLVGCWLIRIMVFDGIGQGKAVAEK